MSSLNFFTGFFLAASTPRSSSPRIPYLKWNCSRVTITCENYAFLTDFYPYFMKIRSKNWIQTWINHFFILFSQKDLKSGKRRKILSRHPFWDIKDICGLKTFQTSFFGVFSWLCSWLFRNVSIGIMGAETVGNILTYLWPLSIFVTKKYAFFAIFWA